MASNEDRVGKFLRRLLQRRSALEIAQTLAWEEQSRASTHSWRQLCVRCVA